MTKSIIPIVSLISSIFLLNYNLNKLTRENSKISILFFIIEIVCIYSLAYIFTKINLEHRKIKNLINHKTDMFVSGIWFFMFLFLTIYYLYKNNLILDINIYTLSCFILVILSFVFHKINLNIYYLLSILFLIGFIPKSFADINIIFFKKNLKLIDLLYSSMLLTSTFSMLLKLITRYLFSKRL